MTETSYIIENPDGDQMKVVRAKWSLDGATTLAEAAEKARDLAAHLQDLHNQGYTLEGPIGDDYGFLVPPPSATG